MSQTFHSSTFPSSVSPSPAFPDPAIPDRMRHAAVPVPGGPDAIRIVDGPVPHPAPGCVLIRVEAAGINRPDLLQRAGNYDPPAGASPILGLEVAGAVVALGAGVTSLAVGDEVAALVNGGGYAEFCVAPAGQCLPRPASYDAVRAAALPENLFTVWSNIFAPVEDGGAALRPGETILVHGGTSGIGLTALHLAAAFGMRAIATAGTAAKCRVAERHGAEAAIPRHEDWPARVAELTAGRGCDVVLDFAGGPAFARNIACLAADGRLVLIGFMGGPVAEQVKLVPIVQRRLHITGSMLRPRSAAAKARIAAALRAHVWPLLEAGGAAPVIDRVFPFAEAAAAHALLESGAPLGKLVLRMS